MARVQLGQVININIINNNNKTIVLSISSTFGVTGNKWRLSARATVTTMASSFGGGLVALITSFVQHKGKIDVLATINGVLGALVGITGGNATKFVRKLCMLLIQCFRLLCL